MTFFVLGADGNRDRAVNFEDLLVLARNYGHSGRTFSQGNFDYSADGKVDFNDLLLLARQYNSTVAAPAALEVSNVAPTRRREAFAETVIT
jgi:hypothetical protein